MIPYYFRHQDVETLLFLLGFVRTGWILPSRRESAHPFPEFLEPIADGLIQLLPCLTQFVGVLGGKELMNKESDWVAHSWLGFLDCTAPDELIALQ